MAPRKKADDKSQPLAAAAVGAGTELVQAQTEQNKDGTVLVDPDAEAARLEAEQQAAEEARLAAEQQAAEAARLEAEQQAAEEARLAAEEGVVTSDLPDWLLGQFDVKAKSPAGFWRCQVQFLHSSATRVFVVENKAAVPHDHDCAIPCCYLTPEEAQRVHQESWLTVVPGSEVTKD
ncbi:hypothetical protein [Aeromonas hydrophila]|uniref:hypothetical protein n=1 Tax=Aeromonas hydrophila TaxID=644 RepID=UPI002B05F1CD|nr:hypothetical protein [Aeromonas hydrophila]